ncbi:hypothetical protein [Microvirga sp. KLBC 81]|uniref:hypothetical protein n=1 Tax=Microvirga sp. KLBC 81 TaxID=1862707 RepID=UPI00105832E2|nr:hypothetical protein [Microvirga sp. KLBC 81]
MPTLIAELVRLALSHGLSDSSLDEEVHNAALSAAAAANNDGLPGQIAFLISQIGVDATCKIIGVPMPDGSDMPGVSAPVHSQFSRHSPVRGH